MYLSVFFVAHSQQERIASARAYRGQAGPGPSPWLMRLDAGQRSAVQGYQRLMALRPLTSRLGKGEGSVEQLFCPVCVGNEFLVPSSLTTKKIQGYQN